MTTPSQACTCQEAEPAREKATGGMSGPRVVSNLSIRELIIELTHVEDAIRYARTEDPQRQGSGLLNPDLLPLVRCERVIVGELRRRSARGRSTVVQPALTSLS